MLRPCFSRSLLLSTPACRTARWRGQGMSTTRPCRVPSQADFGAGGLTLPPRVREWLRVRVASAAVDDALTLRTMYAHPRSPPTRQGSIVTARHTAPLLCHAPPLNSGCAVQVGARVCVCVLVDVGWAMGRRRSVGMSRQRGRAG